MNWRCSRWHASSDCVTLRRHRVYCSHLLDWEIWVVTVRKTFPVSLQNHPLVSWEHPHRLFECSTDEPSGLGQPAWNLTCWYGPDCHTNLQLSMRVKKIGGTIWTYLQEQQIPKIGGTWETYMVDCGEFMRCWGSLMCKKSGLENGRPFTSWF